MGLFNRAKKKQGSAGEAGRIIRELVELLDPYDERTLVVLGKDGKAVTSPAQILANLHDRMERVDLDPDVAWAPEDLMSMAETEVMFKQLGMGALVVSKTAWYARQVLARWPDRVVEQPFLPDARIEMFLDGPEVDPVDGDLGRVVINRALASREQVYVHPELDDLPLNQLVAVWLSVVFWFGIRSGALHRSGQ